MIRILAAVCWIFLIFAAPAVAVEGDLRLAPPAFADARGRRVVFADFLEARYSLELIVSDKSARSRDVIRFRLDEKGHAIFDLHTAPRSARVDGETVGVAEVADPDRVTKYWMIDRELAAGEHELVVEHELRDQVKRGEAGVALGFFMSDLDDRGFLEKYLTTSFEYDAYRMTIDFSLQGASGEQAVYANGDVRKNGDYRWTISYPDHFSSSSVYFHTLPETGLNSTAFSFRSVDGREISVQVYTKAENRDFDAFVKATPKTLAGLEADYGPFPHERVVIYGVGPLYGGMEHCGATITSLRALGHELAHSYFARGVMPANGNAGWIDEAIASWRDAGYPPKAEPGFAGSAMGRHSVYMRMTDDRAYKEGRDFLAYLDHLLAEQGGLKPQLRALVTEHRHARIHNEDFIAHLERGTGRELRALFDRYILGRDPTPKRGEWPRENPFHPRLTEAQLDRLP